MNIDINAAFDAGLKKEDIEKMMKDALDSAIKEREAQEEARKKESDKEALKLEGRAYAINALICYIKAFDLLPEDDELDEEDVAALEEMMKKIERMIPVYAKMLDLEKGFFDGLM